MAAGAVAAGAMDQRVSDQTAGAACEAWPTFFTCDGDTFVPGSACRSPWNPEHQNGVAIAALLTHAAEGAPSLCPMLGARLNIDILAPTPFAPVRVETRVVREGRKMQVVEAAILCEARVTARARLLRLRRRSSPALDEPLPYPAVEDCATRSMLRSDSRIGAMVETRPVEGDFETPGPAVIWARFRANILPGIPAAGLTQTAMLSDFGNGLSSPVRRAEWSYANVDITVQQVRDPVGSWVLLASETMLMGEGVALVNTTLGDSRGSFGRAHQTLFIGPR